MIINYYKYKKQLLKIENKVGMAVLKGKQTRVVYRDNQQLRDNQHIRILHPNVNVKYSIAQLSVQTATIGVFNPGVMSNTQAQLWVQTAATGVFNPAKQAYCCRNEQCRHFPGEM